MCSRADPQVNRVAAVSNRTPHCSGGFAASLIELVFATDNASEPRYDRDPSSTAAMAAARTIRMVKPTEPLLPRTLDIGRRETDLCYRLRLPRMAPEPLRPHSEAPSTVTGLAALPLKVEEDLSSARRATRQVCSNEATASSHAALSLLATSSPSGHLSIVSFV